MYLVLARKYRPQSFEQIIGQEHVTRTLANALEKGRVHHAFLFCGPRGVGKTTAARVLARALCCEKGPTPTPCGECEPCRAIAAGTAVDYFEIDGASNNSVDDVRELRDGVRYQPAQLRRKIYVIDEVHMLSTAAFNALLKTLEEPPPHVTFIFATTEVHKIPVTILSRCQRYDFKLVPGSRLVAHLEKVFAAEAIPAERGGLTLLAREAGGSVRDMLSLADQVIAYVGGEGVTEARVAEVLGVADRALLGELSRAVLAGDGRAALTAVEAASGRGVDLAHFARSFLSTLRDLAVVQSVKDPEGLLDATDEEVKALRALTAGATRPQLLALFDRMAHACEDLARSQSPRLVLEIALLDMAGSEPLLPITDLVDRLESLERRLAAGGATGPGPVRPPRSTGPSMGSGSGAGGFSAGGGSHGTGSFSAGSSSHGASGLSAGGNGHGAGGFSAGGGAPGLRSQRSGSEPAQAAPARAPANPRPTAAPPADPMAAWEQIILALESRSVTLAAMYANARLLAWTEAGIELGFPAGSLGLGTDADHIASLKRFLDEHTGSAIDVRVRTVAAPPRGADPSAPGPAEARTPTSLAEVEDGRRRKERSRRETEAREHPTTRAVLETFGASVKEIKIDE